MSRYLSLAFAVLVLSLLALLASCSGDDRSGERPYAPTVRTLGAWVSGDSVRLTGEIVSSPNSPVTGRGFYYGNDTLRIRLISSDTLDTFSEVVDSLRPGYYYAYAFAANGIGTTNGDTLIFYVAP